MHSNLCDNILIIAGSSNGRTTGFGPVNLGSSPSPAAIISLERVKEMLDEICFPLFLVAQLI